VIYQLRTFSMTDYEEVLALWHKTGLRVGPTDSREGITKKIAREGDLFVVAEIDKQVIGAVMGCYDGRRGWANHVAVDPAYQGRGIGTALLTELEKRLRAYGCAKLNLMIARHNASVQVFYEKLGFDTDDVIFMQKWLSDTPRQSQEERSDAENSIEIKAIK
jgi:ribosomal protein S18 acetylase RimI-like enzyme